MQLFERCESFTSTQELCCCSVRGLKRNQCTDLGSLLWQFFSLTLMPTVNYVKHCHTSPENLFLDKSSPIFGIPKTIGEGIALRGEGMVFNTLLPHTLFLGLCINLFSLQSYGWCKGACIKGFTAGFTGSTVCPSSSQHVGCMLEGSGQQPSNVVGLSLIFSLSSTDWSPVIQTPVRDHKHHKTLQFFL